MADQEKQFNPETSKVNEGSFIEEFGEPSFKAGLDARKPFERRALLASLFIAGDQWADVYSDNAGHYQRRNLTPENCDQVRRVNNQIPIHIRGIMGGMTSGVPEFEGVPATFDIEDVESAQLTTQILGMYDEINREGNLRRQEQQYMLAHGEAYRLTLWDPKVQREDYRGDVDSAVFSLFNAIKDPQSVDIWPARWFIHYDARHVDEVRAAYGRNDIEPEDVSDFNYNLDRLAMNVPGKSGSRDALKDHVLDKRMYVPPSERYPNGYSWRWANGKMAEPHELQGGVWPISRAEWFPVGLRLYAMSLIELIMADQRQINLILSQLQDVANRQIRQDIITQGTPGAAGRAVEVVIDPKTGRKQIQLPPGIEKYDLLRYDGIWGNSAELLDRLYEDVRQKTARNKAVAGQEMSKQITVGELQISREADMEALAWHMEMYSENHLLEVQRAKLRLVQRFCQSQRLVETYGRSQANAVPYFTGSDLTGTRDVVTVPTPHLTPAMKRQAKFQAFTGGMMGPYESPQAQYAARKVLRQMGLADLEEELSAAYGPLDDLEQFVGGLEQASRQAIVMRAKAALELAANPQPQQPTEEAPAEMAAAG